MNRFGVSIIKISFLVVGCALLLETEAATGQTDNSHLIIKASVSNTDMQPYWICLTRAQRCKHVSASEGLVSLRAGKYELHHVDFAKSLESGDTDRDPVTNKKARSGGGTQYFVKSIKLNVEPGLIYFVGDLVLTQKKSRKYKIELNQDTSLVIEACRKFPSVFEKYPVTDINNKEKVKVSCQNKNK